jgi:hypothetical protein
MILIFLIRILNMAIWKEKLNYSKYEVFKNIDA